MSFGFTAALGWLIATEVNRATCLSTQFPEKLLLMVLFEVSANEIQLSFCCAQLES